MLRSKALLWWMMCSALILAAIGMQGSFGKQQEVPLSSDALPDARTSEVDTERGNKAHRAAGQDSTAQSPAVIAGQDLDLDIDIIPWIDQASGLEPVCLSVGEHHTTIAVRRQQDQEDLLGLITTGDNGHSWTTVGPCLDGADWLSISHHQQLIHTILIDHHNQLVGARWNGERWLDWPLPEWARFAHDVVLVEVTQNTMIGNFYLTGQRIATAMYRHGNWHLGEITTHGSGSSGIANQHRSRQHEQWRINNDGQILRSHGNRAWQAVPQQPQQVWGEMRRRGNVADLRNS